MLLENLQHELTEAGIMQGVAQGIGRFAGNVAQGYRQTAGGGGQQGGQQQGGQVDYHQVANQLYQATSQNQPLDSVLSQLTPETIQATMKYMNTYIASSQKIVANLGKYLNQKNKQTPAQPNQQQPLPTK